MLDVRALQKDTVYEVMLQQMYSLNHMWLRLELYIAEKAPSDYRTDEYYQLYEDYGSHEAGRLARVLALPGEGIRDLAAYLRHSHWAVFENIDIAEMTPTSFRMRTLDCSAQRAARKWGMQHYDCGTGGLRVRRGFFTKLNPQARVEKIFAPCDNRPEGTPENISCEWLISLK